ncbi:hypothetical protein [Runella sp.]|uniref:hypothetical protein n=1 Tax=Runella sp. TaxID=1960881 RepID=UPI0030165804
MKKAFFYHCRFIGSLTLLLGLESLIGGCKEKANPITEQVKKVWIAQTVKENTTLVYTKGSMSNIRNYTPFKLNLSQSAVASFTDWDGLTCTGLYELPSNTRLVLKSLTPQPTGTNGTIEFTINSISDTQLDLTRTTASSKTGGSSNQYLLSNQ